MKQRAKQVDVQEYKYVKHMAKHAVDLGAAKKKAPDAERGAGGVGGSTSVGSCASGDGDGGDERAYDALLRGSVNFILIRDPASIASSFSEVCPPTLEETCLPALCQVFSDLRRMHPNGRGEASITHKQALIRALRYQS